MPLPTTTLLRICDLGVTAVDLSHAANVRSEGATVIASLYAKEAIADFEVPYHFEFSFTRRNNTSSSYLTSSRMGLQIDSKRHSMYVIFFGLATDIDVKNLA